MTVDFSERRPEEVISIFWLQQRLDIECVPDG